MSVPVPASGKYRLGSRNWMDRVTAALSAEFLLRHRANSGGVVLVRAIWVTALTFPAAVLVSEWTDPAAVAATSRLAILRAIHDHLTWLGAIFAGAYVSLYARFASQYTYLSGVYYQIMATIAQMSLDLERDRAEHIATWWAAFIEDAQDTHLALKRSNATLIAELLGRSMVVSAYTAGTVRGQQRLQELQQELERVLGTAEVDRLREAGRVAQERRLTPPTGTAAISPPPRPPEQTR